MVIVPSGKNIFSVATLLAVLLACQVFSPALVSAQRGSGCDPNNPNNAGQICAIVTAVPFLTVAPDARGGALGDAGVSIANDATAMHWNPARLATTTRSMGVSFAYSPWLQAMDIPGINLFYLPAYFRLGERNGVIGASLRYFSLGDIQLADDVGNLTGNINPAEWALSAAYARKISDKVSVGVALRYINSNITGSVTVGGLSTQPGRSAAGDVSFAYETPVGNQGYVFGLGMNISNIGAKMKYTSSQDEMDFLPTNMRLGWSLKVPFDEYNSLAFINDFNKLLVPSYPTSEEGDVSAVQGMLQSFTDAPGGFREERREINISTGLEYNYNNLLFVRGGYFYEHETKGDRQFLTLGAGFKLQSFSLDLSYLATLGDNNHPLQNTLRFTIGAEFGEDFSD